MTTDERLALWVGAVLRAGVSTAAALVAAGAAIYLSRQGHETISYRVFHGGSPGLTTLPGIVRAALTLEGRGIIQLGVLVLIATPVARVALSLVGFALERDRTYLVVSSIVLATLLASLAGG